MRNNDDLFFVNDSATTVISTLSLHDALPISVAGLLVWTSASLALLTFALMVPLIWVAARYSRRSHPVLKDVQQRVADVTTQADRKSTRLNSSHANISYAVFCLKKKHLNRSTA